MQFKLPRPLPVGVIAEALEGTLEGDPSIPIRGVASPNTAQEGDLTFLLSPEAIAGAAGSGAAAVVAPPDSEIPGKTIIRGENPRYAMAPGLPRPWCPA